jgi:plastocyanin
MLAVHYQRISPGCTVYIRRHLYSRETLSSGEACIDTGLITSQSSNMLGFLLTVLTLVMTEALSTTVTRDIDGATGAVNSTTPTVIENEITVHKISVGETQHYFTPNSINALPGDIVMFSFWPGNHSVIRAEYGFPCIPYEDVQENEAHGFYSGVQSPDASDVAENRVRTIGRHKKMNPMLRYLAAPDMELDGQYHRPDILLLRSTRKLRRLGYAGCDQCRRKSRNRDPDRDGKGWSTSDFCAKDEC